VTAINGHHFEARDNSKYLKVFHKGATKPELAGQTGKRVFPNKMRSTLA